MEYNYDSEGSVLGSDSDVTAPKKQKKDQSLSLPMNRSSGSGSAVGGDRSTGFSGNQSVSLSPITSYSGSPISDWGFTRRESPYGNSRNNFLSPEPAAVSPNPDSNLPLFHIERDGDPRIDWYMYYDFVVTKTEAYYELQPGYLATDKYPQQVKSEKVIFQGEKRHPCRVPGCNSGPFTRHYGLERHFRTIHHRDAEPKYYCDYPKCPRAKEPFWKIHGCREHYRGYHCEDLIKRFKAKPDRFTIENKNSKLTQRKPQNVEEFLATRRHIHVNWWRCTKCIQRVQVNNDGYMCPRCKVSCENERIAFRNKVIAKTNSRLLDLESSFDNNTLWAT